MTFYDICSKYQNFNFEKQFENIDEFDIFRALEKKPLDENGFLALLSPKAGDYLEIIARKAKDVTIKNFGKVIYLYAPMYLSNFCDNECIYCGFKHSNEILRKKLSIDEVEQEAKVLSETGILHVLILTGESRKEAPVSYVKEGVKVLKRYFSSISIEIYPLQKEEYAELIAEGVDGLTIYQETYDEKLYSEIHKKGFKRNYRFRLETPERACQAGIRNVSLGALLGMSDFRKDVFFAGLHALYLQNNFPETEISISFPRMQPHTGNFVPPFLVTDKEMVQSIIASRILLPRAGINISTRENNEFRTNLLGLGVTKMSAGSSTEVGGYSASQKTGGQFDISDKSSVSEVKKLIYSKGYQPVMKDWQIL